MAGSSTELNRLRAITVQLKIMGWRLVTETEGEVKLKMWVKHYPPPHEIVGGSGSTRVIAEYGSDVWQRDLRRAEAFAEEAGYKTTWP